MRGAALAALAVLAACAEPAEPPPRGSSPVGEVLAAIREHEEARREETDFTSVPGRHRALGPDPSSIAALPDGAIAVALRGEEAVALLDVELVELDRAAGPPLLADVVVLDGAVVAGGEGSASLRRWSVDEGRLVAAAPIELAPGTAVRALAADGPFGFAVDALADVLVTFDRDGERARVATAAMPIHVAATPSHVVVASLVGHTIEVFARDPAGLPDAAPIAVARRGGPAWGLAVAAHEGDLWIAIGAPEDAPLDRTIGSFGYVDSVVELRRVRGAEVELVATFPAGEHGVVVPKALGLVVDERAVVVAAIGAGSGRAATIRWPRAGEALAPPSSTSRAVPPGTADALFAPDGAVLAAASPLLDAWWSDAAGLARATPSRPDPRSASSRLGEALLTTTLLAPDQRSDGPLSRFTCETCHLDLGIDGRTHATGRGDGTVATTKPLDGLLNNGPHFTRAMDRDLTEVAHNEVAVANLGTGVNPWSTIDPTRAPWLVDLLGGPVEPSLLRPAGVRRALVDALADRAHRPNPRVLGRAAFTDLEARGAATFRDRCAGCHAPRLVTSEPATEVPFERWEELVLSDAGPIVWAREGYERTGIEPTVHPDGARTTSLRRVLEKRPYFTDGSSPSLDDVLERVRLRDGDVLHAAPDGARLDGETREALRAFLDLL